ncbi:MAG: GSU2403 family nucleotidyltransferase fold protein [Burkholderiales bacterium]
MLFIMRLTDEQARALTNAGQLYDSWRDVTRALSKLPGGMYWRVINSKEYLYQYAKAPAGLQQTKSLGPRSPELEDKFQEFRQTKDDLDERRGAMAARLKEMAPAWRALRLPAIDRTAGRILRALDQGDFVGTSILVVGSYALKAYEVESASTFSAGMDATDDLDFTLLVGRRDVEVDLPRRLLLMLKQADSSFIVSPSSSHTLVNKSGYKVDLLSNKSVAEKLSDARPWKPQPLEGQEWLLLGKPVSAVLIDFEGWPAAISAPDPRYFALHKLWLSTRHGRPAVKRAKDERQGKAALEAIAQYMPHYPMDQAFVATLPGELKKYLPNTAAGDKSAASSSEPRRRR